MLLDGGYSELNVERCTGLGLNARARECRDVSCGAAIIDCHLRSTKMTVAQLEIYSRK